MKVVIAVTAVVLITIAVAFTAYATVAGAKRNAFRIADKLYELGFDVRETYQYGLLAKGGSYVLNTTLYEGNSYVFVAGGCQDAYDIDLILFDENGNLIDRDRDNDTLAVVEVSPIWTGPFYLKIVMADSTANGAHWVLLTAYK